MKENQFYCVSCRRKVTIHADDICVKTVRNKKIGSVPMLKGYCNKCDCRVNKFIKRKDAKRMKDKYGTCRGR